MMRADSNFCKQFPRETSSLSYRPSYHVASRPRGTLFSNTDDVFLSRSVERARVLSVRHQTVRRINSSESSHLINNDIVRYELGGELPARVFVTAD